MEETLTIRQIEKIISNTKNPPYNIIPKDIKISVLGRCVDFMKFYAGFLPNGTLVVYDIFRIVYTPTRYIERRLPESFKI